MPAHHYDQSGRRRNATLEMVVTMVVVAGVVVAVLVFLFVYHDFPLRVSGP